MIRKTPWPVAIVGLCLAALVLVGCQSGSSTNAPPANSIPASKSTGITGAERTPENKLFRDWPTPEGALLISGEQIGYLEPCGCTDGQKGGLARRYDLIDRLREQGWKLALIDLGSLINDPNARPHGGPEQTKIKFDFALKALGLMGYDAVALSPVDLKLTIAETVGRVLQIGDRPKIVCANVSPIPALADPPAGQSPKFERAIRTTAGPYKIGVTAVLTLPELEKLSDPDKETLLTVQPAESAAASVLADLEKDTDLQVLMVQGTSEAARRLAESNPGYDVVVATSPFPDPEKDPVMLNKGRTMLVQVGKKGQYVGVIGLFPKGERKYQRVQLGNRFNGKFEPMRKLIDEEMQDVFRQAGVVENYTRIPSYPGAPEGSTFVGADTCKNCHPATFAKWSATKHARAYDDLVKDPHDSRRNRENDAECVTCHTTGFEYGGGFVSASATPYLKGNQCENCHGPGSKHSESPDDPAFRKAISRTIADFDKNHRCIACHDEDNSPHGFDLPTKWGQIAHKGLDRYDDPKVHKGVAGPAPKAPTP